MRVFREVWREESVFKVCKPGRFPGDGEERENEVVFATKDHKPNSLEEQDRI